MTPTQPPPRLERGLVAARILTQEERRLTTSVRPSMRKTGIFERLVSAALKASQQEYSWYVDDLADDIAKQVGTTDKTSARYAVRALCAVGAADYSEDGKRVLRNDDYRSGDDSALKEVVKGLKTQLEAEKAATAKEQERALRAEEAAAKAKADAIKSSGVYEIRCYDKPNGKPRVVEGVFHERLPRLLQLARARMNVFCYGPTGVGKTHIAGQVAEVLGLRFAFVSCTAGMSEGQITGRLLPLGKQGTFEYISSEFVQCYEEGGVFLFDEIDAADANVLLVINAALANRHLALPNRPDKPVAKKHKDFICFAAANTVGTGADRTYSGRNKLDAATLDRFQIGKVLLHYDERVDAHLCPDDELRAKLLRYRAAVLTHKMERAVSTRFVRDAYKMTHPEAFGLEQDAWTFSDVEAALFEGWRRDEVEKVKNYQR